jgi:AhpD family alkylhydroperoxidase
LSVPSYRVHTIEAAPAASRPLLEQAQAAYGAVPNLLAVLSSAPPVLEAYLTLQKLFAAISLSSAEQQVVLLTVSTDNACTCCVSAHTLMAGTQGVVSTRRLWRSAGARGGAGHCLQDPVELRQSPDRDALGRHV